MCTHCNETISRGKTIGIINHTGVIRNAVKATCTSKGYSGDEYCSFCNKKLSTGNETGLTDHISEIRNERNATCTTEGYSGDCYCSACNKHLSSGNAIPVTAHIPTLRNVKNPTCNSEGYSGDTHCEGCNILISKGNAIGKTGHQSTEIRNVRNATTKATGYTGDTYCKDCNTLLSTGNEIPKLQSVVGISDIERSIFDDINEARQNQGLGELEWDPELYPAVNIRANEYMYWLNEGNKKGDAHCRPNGDPYTTVFNEVGLGSVLYSRYGEILVFHTYSEELFNSWMASPGHYSIIMGEAYTHISISVIHNPKGSYACAILRGEKL